MTTLQWIAWANKTKIFLLMGVSKYKTEPWGFSWIEIQKLWNSIRVTVMKAAKAWRIQDLEYRFSLLRNIKVKNSVWLYTDEWK